MILDFNLNEVMRLSHVKRWSVVEMSRSQSVAEHSYNVAMIATAIVDKLEKLTHVPHNLRGNVMSWALLHDVPECLTGDMPTPFKNVLGGEVGVAERAVFPKYAELKDGIGDWPITIVKIADIFEAMIFTEKYCCDPRAEEVYNHLSDGLTRLLSVVDPAIGDNVMPILNNLRNEKSIVDKIWVD